MALISGTSGNDVLVDVIGLDLLRGGAGNDVLKTDSARDSTWDYVDIRFTEPEQVFDGGSGVDTIDLSNSVNARSVIDLVHNILVEGTWRTFGPEGLHSRLVSIENIIGSNRSDKIRGNEKDNILDGGGGSDAISGGAGNDILIGRGGRDALVGGPGIDLFDGGAGYDSAEFWDLTVDGTTIDLGRGEARYANGDVERLIDIEAVVGTAGDDRLLGSSGNDHLDGFQGDDAIRGDSGDDELFGHSGNDVFVYTSASDGNDDIFDFGIGADTIDLSALLRSTGKTGANIDLDENTSAFTTTISVDGVDNFSIKVHRADLSNFDVDRDRGLIKAHDANSVVLDNVPSYEWVFSCVDQAMASIASFWDMHGYDNLMAGQGWDELKLTTDKVWTDMVSAKHFEKYAPKPDDSTVDSPGDSLAHFAKVGMGNKNYSASGSPYNGLEKYTEFKGYDNFNKNTINITWDWDNRKDQIWDSLKSEIDAGRPMLNGLPFHLVPVIGYAESGDGSRYYAYYVGYSSQSTVYGEAEQVRWQPFVPYDNHSPSLDTIPVRVLGFFKPADITVEGSSADERLKGDGGDDVIRGRGGNDILEGGIGHDLIDGGSGSDTAVYARGADAYDLEVGGDGGATIRGPEGTDTLVNIEYVQFADKTVEIATGGSTDTNTSNDEPTDTGGDDPADDEPTTNVISGDSGDDELIGTSDDDILIGDYGTDNFYGGGGVDTVDYSYSTQDGTIIDLEQGVATFSGGTVESLVDIQNIIGSQGDDTIFGDDGDNVLMGGDGDDRLEGRFGSDTFDGGAGIDTVDFFYSMQSGTIMDLRAGFATFTGGTVEALIDIENIAGSRGDDTIVSDDGDNVIDGNLGFDTVVFAGNRDAYTIDTTNGVTTVTGEGVDVLTNIEALSFSDGDFLL